MRFQPVKAGVRDPPLSVLPVYDDRLQSTQCFLPSETRLLPQVLRYQRDWWTLCPLYPREENNGRNCLKMMIDKIRIVELKHKGEMRQNVKQEWQFVVEENWFEFDLASLRLVYVKICGNILLLKIQGHQNGKIFWMFFKYLVSILDHPRRSRGSRVRRNGATKVFRHGGSSQHVLERLHRAVSYDPTECPWVSEDDVR